MVTTVPQTQRPWLAEEDSAGAAKAGFEPAGGQALEPRTPTSHRGSDVQGLVEIEVERGTLSTSRRTLSSGPRSFLTAQMAFESLDLDPFVCQTRPCLGEGLARGLSQIPFAEMTPGDSPPRAQVLSEGFSGNVLYTL